jgi:HEAT repeat protein
VITASLVQHVDQRVEQGYSGLSSKELLQDFPAGAALGRIGEPAIPALSSVLETGAIEKRWVASRALNMIEAREATDALSKQLLHESDEKLRAYIEEIVRRRRAGLPH